MRNKRSNGTAPRITSYRRLKLNARDTNAVSGTAIVGGSVFSSSLAPWQLAIAPVVLPARLAVAVALALRLGAVAIRLENKLSGVVRL
jgi:hypothetical protein